MGRWNCGDLLARGASPISGQNPRQQQMSLLPDELQFLTSSRPVPDHRQECGEPDTDSHLGASHFNISMLGWVGAGPSAPACNVRACEIDGIKLASPGMTSVDT
jgi:hypothetical protein